ncbi:MAG: hypothetical protein J6M07_01680, partial [Ruminococcus sp.]|nr:hypothetical protein [Ruminococcus sp.]
CYYLNRKTENIGVGRFIRYCSVNLNTIYIIQWIIIAYSVAIGILFGIEKTRSPLIIISGGVTVTAVSIAISFPFVKLENKN